MSAYASRPVKKLGDILVEEDLITPEQLQEALGYQEKQPMYIALGEAVVKLGFLSQNNLNQLLKRHRKRMRLGDLLLNLRLIDKEKLDAALEVQRNDNGRLLLGDILVREGFVSENSLLNSISIQLGIKKITPELSLIDKSLMRSIKESYARNNLVIPAYRDGRTVVAIMANPLNLGKIRELEDLLQAPVEAAIASSREIRNALDRFYGFEEDAYNAILPFEGIKINKADVIGEAGADAVESLNYIIGQAVVERASDIHLEPMNDRLRVRYRIDGVTQHRTDYPLFIMPNIIARLKALSGIDLANTKRHQDGRLQIKYMDRDIDLRISTYAAIHGENIVIRILDHDTAITYDVNKLGFNPANMKRFMKQLSQPTGVMLVTGPTGSGKTTALYASLNYLNDIGRVIVTVEDPVELELEGIVQAQINPHFNLSYSDYIKAMMRQDPDILMVGEIRDRSAAEAVVQCALTGHKVFSTFHTDDTTGALLRLMDMGINTFLISSTIVSVCSQRLVRVLCSRCKTVEKPDPALVAQFSINPEGLDNYELFAPKGCPYCNYTGYHGRTGLHELLVVNDEIRDVILERQTSSRIRSVSRQTAEMISMQEDGVYKCLKGATSLEEVLRTSSFSEVDKQTGRTAFEILEICEKEKGEKISVQTGL